MRITPIVKGRLEVGESGLVFTMGGITFRLGFSSNIVCKVGAIYCSNILVPSALMLDCLPNGVVCNLWTIFGFSFTNRDGVGPNIQNCLLNASLAFNVSWSFTSFNREVWYAFTTELFIPGPFSSIEEIFTFIFPRTTFFKKFPTTICCSFFRIEFTISFKNIFTSNSSSTTFLFFME